jgi:tRNA1(Val) A37 N6-methylase TrmN6
VSDSRTFAATLDALLGGRVTLRQPVTGYRVAIDPVMLAAATEPAKGSRAADLGCGVGAALLCLGRRRPDLSLVGLEISPRLVQLARENVVANGFAERAEIVQGDVRAPPRALAPNIFDAVMINPPYLETARADPPPQADKRRAMVEDGGDGLVRWVTAALRLLRPKGSLVVIQRADRLDDLLIAIAGRAGEIVVYPLWPKMGGAATRVIVRGRKGMRGAMRLDHGLVLHEPDGQFTTSADAILRQGARLEL